MAKYYGTIGYSLSTETAPGVYSGDITERTVYGDILKLTSKNEKSEYLNDNISLSARISFLADPFAIQNFNLIKYATYLGVKWSVLNIEPAFPRLILTLGSEYNGGNT